MPRALRSPVASGPTSGCEKVSVPTAGGERRKQRWPYQISRCLNASAESCAASCLPDCVILMIIFAIISVMENEREGPDDIARPGEDALNPSAALLNGATS
jgi:hypothetical protein